MGNACGNVCEGDLLNQPEIVSALRPAAQKVSNHDLRNGDNNFRNRADMRTDQTYQS